MFLMRVTLPDRPGSLGSVATAMGGVGGDINAVEIVHLLGSSHTIEALAIRYAGLDPTAEHLSVGRAILSRWGSRVVHLELCPSFLAMLGAEGAGWNAAAAAVKAVDPDALPPSLYHAPEPVEAEGETV